MAVIKKLTCNSCHNAREVSVQLRPKDMTACPKCGSLDRTYDAKWTVYLLLVDENGGKYRYRKAWSELKSDAVLHEASMKLSKARGERQKKDTPYTFEMAASFFETWVASKLGEKLLSGGMAKSYVSRLSVHLKPYFKGADIRFLTETDVEAYRACRRGCIPVPAPASINREVATLKRMTSLLYKRKLIQHDPLDGIEMLKEDNVRDQVLTPAQLEAMVSECDRMAYCPRHKKEFRVYPEHLKVAVLIGLNTGLRIDGVLTLRWEEIDWTRGEIKKVVKGGRELRIPINPTLNRALLEWRGLQRVVKTYVIPSPKKDDAHMLITSNFGFKRLCAAVGIIDFTFHQLRHQFATYFIMHTKDINLCAKILGHSTTYITERYSHLVEGEAEKAMRTFTI